MKNKSLRDEEVAMDTLNLVAQIAAIIGAATLIAVAPLEMFFYARPFARKFLHVETANIDDARLWASTLR